MCRHRHGLDDSACLNRRSLCSRRLRSVLSVQKPIGPFRFSVLAILLGIVAGVGALGFRALISFFHNLFFLCRISLDYDSNQHTPLGPLGHRR
jgi:hypothetical protein